MKCEHPKRGVWGATQLGYRSPVMGAVRLPYVTRAGLKLSSFMREDAPELGFTFEPPDAGAASPSVGDGGSGKSAPQKRGCSGCTVGGADDSAAIAIAIPIVALGVRRRRRPR